MKPLFIPLKSEYFEAFASGTKREELRLEGRGWNRRTCFSGRNVILSNGYGKKNRLTGEIHGVETKSARMLPLDQMKAIENVYGYAALDKHVIVIHIRDIKPVVQS